jgi:diguanylate cyclase (GGDEF)-like protein
MITTFRIPASLRSGLRLALLLNPKNIMPEQLVPLIRNSAGTLAASTVVAAFVAMSIRSHGLEERSALWALVCMTVNICGGLSVYFIRRNFSQPKDMVMASWIMTISAALRGLVWGVGFAILLPHASNYEQIILGWVVAGLMCGGAFSSWSHPPSAIGFTALSALGGAIGMGSIEGIGEFGIHYIVLIMFAVLVRAVFTSAIVLRQSITAEHDIAHKNEVISLLLKDFEESASDWLWETDLEGHFIRGADRFARVLELPQSRTIGRSFLAIAEIYGTDCPENDLFRAKLQARDAFSQLTLSMGELGQERYLEVSAKPRLSASGDFMGWRGVASDITDERLADMKVRKLALFDTLTELPNRGFYYDRLNTVLASPSKLGNWVMYLDLDGFKAVNDMFGHAAGDQLLKSVAGRLSSCLPAKGMLARIGGDEFAVVCSGDKQRIDRYWTQIVGSLELPFKVGTNDISIGVSIGVAEIAGEIRGADEIMRRADVALYTAKSSGKGTARFYDFEMDRAQTRRKDIEAGLRKALALDLFVLHYQPIVDIQSGSIHSYEALLRLNTPELGVVAPTDFIPVAEEAGLIVEIGEWVIKQACRDAAKWPDDICVAVNVSSLQLKSNRVLVVVTQALAAAKLAPSRLELELTESALIENVEQTTRILADLKSLGVRLALDDFGTGYSSLSHLHQFNFDKIKIDRSFVQSFGNRRESTAVVNAVVNLARDLGITMTAEGIETDAHLAAMRAVGCDQAQGFLLGRPQPILLVDGKISQRDSA